LRRSQLDGRVATIEIDDFEFELRKAIWVIDASTLNASGEANLAEILDLSALSTETSSISALSGCPKLELTLMPPNPVAETMPDQAKTAIKLGNL